MLPRADPDALADRLESGIRALRERGVDVLLATCFDPQFAFFLKPFRGRAAVFNANLWSIARTHGTFTLDLWGMRELHDPSMWAEDRVHLTPAGHRLLASRAAHALAVPYYEFGPKGAAPRSVPLNTIGWVHRHALPWIGRRIRKESLGDGRDPKLPALISMAPTTGQERAPQ
jgi:hypothetical protein